MAEIAALARPAPERFDGAEAWTRLSPEDQARIGALALELPLVWHLYELEGPAAIGNLSPVLSRAAGAAEAVLFAGLEQAVADALPDDAYTASDGVTPRLPALLGGVCRVCGCSQHDACPGSCGWAAKDLCTACVTGGAS